MLPTTGGVAAAAAAAIVGAVVVASAAAADRSSLRVMYASTPRRMASSLLSSRADSEHLPRGGAGDGRLYRELTDGRGGGVPYPFMAEPFHRARCPMPSLSGGRSTTRFVYRFLGELRPSLLRLLSWERHTADGNRPGAVASRSRKMQQPPSYITSPGRAFQLGSAPERPRPSSPFRPLPFGAQMSAWAVLQYAQQKPPWEMPPRAQDPSTRHRAAKRGRAWGDGGRGVCVSKGK